MKGVKIQVEEEERVAKHCLSPLRCPISRSKSATLLLEALKGDGRMKGNGRI